ncbi:MAG: hypothetical protein EPO61_00505 [Nitrospirae bacterium]|nr:MAG: hypothetical protein EPO61_00505 [Nitrospirota bacterium]
MPYRRSAINSPPRTSPDFWPHSDQMHKAYRQAAPIEWGLFDYNRPSPFHHSLLTVHRPRGQRGVRITVAAGRNLSREGQEEADRGEESGWLRHEPPLRAWRRGRGRRGRLPTPYFASAGCTAVDFTLVPMLFL